MAHCGLWNHSYCLFSDLCQYFICCQKQPCKLLGFSSLNILSQWFFSLAPDTHFGGSLTLSHSVKPRNIFSETREWPNNGVSTRFLWNLLSQDNVGQNLAQFALSLVGRETLSLILHFQGMWPFLFSTTDLSLQWLEMKPSWDRSFHTCSLTKLGYPFCLGRSKMPFLPSRSLSNMCILSRHLYKQKE